MMEENRYEYSVVEYADLKPEYLEAALDKVVGNRRLHSITPLTKERLLLTIENTNGTGRYANLEKDMEQVVDEINGGQL